VQICIRWKHRRNYGPPCITSKDVEAAAIEVHCNGSQPVAAPIGHLGPVDLAALPISTFEKGADS
jgi:hypothetical protein